MSHLPELSTTPRVPLLASSSELTDWARLDRFLVLGTEGTTFEVGDHELTLTDASVVSRCLASDGLLTLDRIVAASQSGRAPKNDPAIFSLAMAAKLGDEPTRRAAYAALPRVCRIGTHLMQFAEYAQGFGGWGRGMRKAVGAWFNARPAPELAFQLASYQTCDGWSNRDLLRLAHPRAASPSHDHLFAWAVKGQLSEDARLDPALELIVAIEELRTISDPGAAASIIRQHCVPRECVPAKLLGSAEVWAALLDTMSIGAVIRNLAPMSRVGLLAYGSKATEQVVARLRDREHRGHPIELLAALVAYRAGRGGLGQGAWLPVVAIVDALESSFYASFRHVELANKRTLIALDVSGSMASGAVAGVPGFTPRIASAALALLAAATEHEHAVVAFTSAREGYGGKWGGGVSELTRLSISPRQRLDEVLAMLGTLPMGGTDCALPMIWAQQNGIDVDTFVVYTDNETWAGDVHPALALRAYREARGIPAKLVVVGMTSNGFSIADPNDAGMLDVVGFDTSTPPVLADFARA
ncbi:MAG: TROVE domain-containing protein [Kofleriaceae bacterium]